MNFARSLSKSSARIAGGLFVLGLAVSTTGRCWAGTFTFYGASDTALGTSATYNSGPNSITAYGFECDGYAGGDTACLNGSNNLHGYVSVDANDLYTKNDGATEQGLGVADDPLGDNEISDETFIDLDMSNLGATSGTLTFSSVQSGESFFFCYGNSHSTWNSGNCTAVFTGAGGNMAENFSLGGSSDISVIASNRDVLLSSLTTSASPTPEPASLSLLGTGLLGLVGVARRGFKRAA